MRYVDGQLVFSPTDLAEFLRSRFASWMTRAALERPELAPGRDAGDPEALPDTAEILARRGGEHEAGVLASLRGRGLDVAEIEMHGPKAPEETLAAMRAGRDVIFQAHLAHAPFAGIADFLVRVPGASHLGGFHYEVWDAKLARQPRPAHLLQLCAYADLLESIQGVRPREVALALGSGEIARFRTDDFFHFYLALRDAFVAFLGAWRADDPPVPEASADHGRWQEEAEQRLEALDHVSRVAGCTATQQRKLAAAGIETLAALAATSVRRVRGLEDRIFARLREQARLQRDSAGDPVPRYRVLAPDEVEEGKGLALLPPPSAGDVCFDLEGDPLEDGSLEYLWGVTYRDEDGALVYRDWWAHDRAGERLALESFLDWLAARRARHPDLHVYHYAGYETAVLRRLVGREATREEALDVLLRAGVFVDLYGVVRHGLRVGTPRYGLKHIERLYRPERAGEVASGMESVVVYDAWRQAGEPPDWRDSKLLRQIRDYNEEDCRSTAELLDWLRARQAEAGIAWRGHSAAGEEDGDTGAATDDGTRPPTERQLLAERLLAGLPATEEARAGEPERWTVQELLGQLLEFHHREDRPVWWELFECAATTVEDRLDRPGCLAGLVRTKRAPFPIQRSWGYEYHYDASQDTKIAEGSPCRIAQLPFLPVTVESIDPVAERLVLKVSEKQLEHAGVDDLPETLCLVLFERVTAKVIEEALYDLATRFATDGRVEPVLRDLLLRRPPRIHGHEPGTPIRREGEPLADAFLRAVRGLDGSVLCVQGPPGSGKTTESAAVICALLRDGYTVGITSNSHKAIENLMRECGKHSGGSLACAKIGGEQEDAPTFPGCEWSQSSNAAADCLDRVSLLGATAWCFARPELEGRIDYLFVDEASQVSLANVAAMTRAARNLVLIGDPVQLSQPTRATHPGASGLSALDHALAGHVTIPPERGLFLETTWRLHPEICRFVSGAFYEDRLHPAPGNERRILLPPPRSARAGRLAVQAAGLVFVPVPHENNTQGSDEEVAVLRELVDELLGRPYTDREGREAGRLTLDDLLLVAPYNLQVRKLTAALPAGARIGTVDRFQGQQAPVVLISMCASEPHLSARGIGFLFHPNRLNVAVSRAQCLAVVVGEPRLATASCRSVEEMRLVNRVCWMLGAAGKA